MADRETKTVTTPDGKELVVKARLTAGERNAIRNIVLADATIDPSQFGQKDDSTITGFDKLPAMILAKQEKAVIEHLVVSYGGKTEGIFAELELGTPEEYDFVVKTINEITSKKA